MKKTLLIIAGIALFAGPTLAQKTAQSDQGTKARAEQQLPRLFAGSGLIRGNDVYDCTGKYLGTDPDPHVQQRLLKEGDQAVCGH